MEMHFSINVVAFEGLVVFFFFSFQNVRLLFMLMEVPTLQ